MPDATSPSPPPKGFLGYADAPRGPEEDSRWLAESRKARRTAAYQINPDIREATPALLAQHITEIDSDDRQAFLAELIQRLAPDDLHTIGDALRQRLAHEAA